LTNAEATSWIWLLPELANFSGTEGTARAAVAAVIGGIEALHLPAVI
jgi:hypothetical protein